MCMEDIRIGSRKWYKITVLTGGTTTAFPGNSSRVGIRMIRQVGTTAVGTFDILTRSGRPTEAIMVANGSYPVDYLTIERDGSIVYEPFDVITSAAHNTTIIETILDDQQNPPPPPKFPGVSIRGPIPTATP